MPRPLTPLQAHQNEVFLDSLARTGNVRLSARAAGVRYGTIQHRRSAHADFAQRWAAIVAAVDARLHLAGGKRGPEASVIASGAKRGQVATSPGRGWRLPGAAGTCISRKVHGGGAGAGLPRRYAPRNDGRENYRTEGGEPMVVRTRGGKLQIRLAHPDKLTQAAEQAFLYALSATANVRLSAAAAGASVAAFYRRRRQNPVFAREMRLALRMGWERLEMAALAAALPENHAHDRWRQCARDVPMPRLSWDQAFQLLCLHEKSVHQSWEQPHRRRRRGESDEIYSLRLQAMWRAEKSIEAEQAAVRRAERFEETGSWRRADEPPPPELPPLELVTGWSRATGKPAHNPDLGLFGGWRIGEMEKARRKGGRPG